MYIVSIHAPAWGATLRSALTTTSSMFQSTHPRGVRLLDLSHIIVHRVEFQSTHPRGVRHSEFGAVRVVDVFQSTHPRGVRPKSGSLPQSSPRVSIHAPAWGATSARKDSRLPPSFQSTHPRGVRHGRDEGRWAEGGFQSTHPRGVRHLKAEREKRQALVSIHAPAWGATP